MAGLTVVYDELIRWGSQDNRTAFRPYTMIDVHGFPAPNAWSGWGLLDTGADDTLLPMHVAELLDIDFSHCIKEEVTIASGEKIVLPKVTVEMTIRGKRIKVDALFGANKTPLIGLHAIVAAMEFGIEFNGWLYRRI